jgi:hypothetical protein
MPAADRPELGLVHDHAYWVSHLRVRDESGDPNSDPARGEIDARSLTHGLGDPTTALVLTPSSGPPVPSLVRGTRWTGTPQVAPENALEVTLENVGQGRIDGRRAGLKGDGPLRIEITSDGPGTLELRLDIPQGAGVTSSGGSPSDVTLDGKGATFTVSAGTREYVIEG